VPRRGGSLHYLALQDLLLFVVRARRSRRVVEDQPAVRAGVHRNRVAGSVAPLEDRHVAGDACHAPRDDGGRDQPLFVLRDDSSKRWNSMV